MVDGARDGSVWIEGEKFCYIDERGEKSCANLSEVSDLVNELQTRIEDIEQEGVIGRDGDENDGSTSNEFDKIFINGYELFIQDTEPSGSDSDEGDVWIDNSEAFN